MEFVQNLYTELLTHTQKVIAYPMSPGQRIFYLYLISSFLFAIGAYVTSSVFKEDRSEGRKFLPGLLHFVFPNSVWGHPSAWVDVRYFLPHQIIRLWIHTDIVVMFYTVGLNSTLFSV